MRVRPGADAALALAECGPKMFVSMFASLIAMMKMFLIVVVAIVLKGWMSDMRRPECSSL